MEARSAGRDCPGSGAAGPQSGYGLDRNTRHGRIYCALLALIPVEDPVSRWPCGQPAAPNPVHRVHQGDLRARNLLPGKFRAREPGVRSGHDAPINLPANAGRNIVAGDAPTASLAIATHRLLKAWRQLVRLFSSLRLFSRRKAPLPGTVLRRQKPAQKKTAPGAIGDRR